MTTCFRRRCESALLHPATITAVVVLLTNDLVFKSLWPDSWVTGKLSDVAWVVFASPLLAFLLSLVTRGNRLPERLAFFAAYVGLPVLYAAYNTFESVHEWVLRGISTTSGGTAGSPLDATDSIVIPVGLAIAVWIWWQTATNSNNAIRRWTLLIAGIAALASVASSAPPPPSEGITAVRVYSDGSIFAREFESRDGGENWVSSGWVLPDGEFTESGGRVETPRGTFMIVGPKVLLLRPDGETEVVYSTGYLSGDGNKWVQGQRYKDHILADGPHGIAYDPVTRNLIAVMGVQGVLVSKPNGQWTRHAVGFYSPTDFSFANRTRLLLSSTSFWAATLALALSITGIGLTISRYRIGNLLHLAQFPLILAFVSVVIVFLLFTIGGADGLFTIGPLILIMAPFVLGAAAGLSPRDSRVRKDLLLAGALCSLSIPCLLLFTFGYVDDSPQYADSESESNAFIVTALVAFALDIVVLALSSDLLVRYWLVVTKALLAMMILLVLAFLLWVNTGIALVLAIVSAIVLPGFVGLALAGHVSRQEHIA